MYNNALYVFLKLNAALAKSKNKFPDKKIHFFKTKDLFCAAKKGFKVLTVKTYVNQTMAV